MDGLIAGPAREHATDSIWFSFGDKMIGISPNSKAFVQKYIANASAILPPIWCLTGLSQIALLTRRRVVLSCSSMFFHMFFLDMA
jgi:hypothetical protein